MTDVTSLLEALREIRRECETKRTLAGEYKVVIECVILPIAKAAIATWEAGMDREREAPALALLREWSSDMMDADRMNCGADYRGPCLDEAGDPIADRTRACWEHRRWWLIAPAEPSPSPPVREGGT